MRTLGAAARRLKPARDARGRALPRLWLLSDPVRLPCPLHAAGRLPRGSAVIARGLAQAALIEMVELARRRGLRLLVSGDGRAALRVGAGLHVPDRRPVRGLLPFLLARRGGAPGLLSRAAHGRRGVWAARVLAADVVLLSPAFGTASHPGVPGLGAHRWAALARATSCPVVALGGIDGRSAALLGRRASGLAAIGGLSR